MQNYLTYNLNLKINFISNKEEYYLKFIFILYMKPIFTFHMYYEKDEFYFFHF